MEEECRAVMQEFFQDLRRHSKEQRKGRGDEN
jgi:hypothetical protein